MIKGLDKLDDNSGGGSDDESAYDKSYIDLPHSANPRLSKSINISIKGKLRRDNHMRNFYRNPVYILMILSVGKLL